MVDFAAWGTMSGTVFNLIAVFTLRLARFG
jgi:hypothetical protein